MNQNVATWVLRVKLIGVPHRSIRSSRHVLASPMNLHSSGPLTPDRIAELLAEARARTRLLVSPLSDQDLRKQHDSLMSPIIWDLGHIGHFEEVWLIESLHAGGDGSEGLRGMYNPFENPRDTRDSLPLPSEEECWRYLGEVRRRVLERLDRPENPEAEELLRNGFVFRMVLQHEYQHNETILQTLQLKEVEPYPAVPGWALPRPPEADGDCGGSTIGDPSSGGVEAGTGADGDAGMVRFPGGTVPIGTDDRSAAYDNERPRHEISLRPFWMDRTPVTNGAYRVFVKDGGYERREFWSDEGWAWLQDAGVRAPKHWNREGTGWTVRVMNRTRPLDPAHPVCHVCCHEAEAYARYAGKRLPTEFEWEAAASFDPDTGERRDFPWGDEPVSTRLANLDQLGFGTAPVDAYAANVSPIGCYGMIGDVWEWTATDFHGYPGYETFPYREYSEAFFGGEYRVLRGGSWATRTGAIRSTFRNWDFPIRRQIFAGFRCARDDS